MLEVGNDGLTIAEQRTHFALWAMAKSPLLIGSDVRSINASSLAILKNKDLIAVSQVSCSPGHNLFISFRQCIFDRR